MKRIFKNKFIACIIAAAVALFAAAFVIFYLNKNDDTVKAHAATAETSMIYWRLSSDKKTLDISASSLTGGFANNNFSCTSSFSTSNTKTWHQYRETVTTVNFASDISPRYSNAWFYAFKSLTTIKNIEKFDATNLVSCYGMFNQCTALTTLDLSSFVTSEKLDNICNMFNGCSNLMSLNVSGLVTSHATDMSYVFNGCSSLTSLDISNFSNESNTGMCSIFQDCKALTSLTVSDSFYKTGEVIDFTNIFLNCESLPESVIVSIASKLDMSKAKYISSMFQGCKKLTSISLPNFTGKEVVQALSLFTNCSNLVSVDLPNFETPKLQLCYDLFDGCTSLTTVNMPKIDMSGISIINSMFYNCSSIVTIDLSYITISNGSNCAAAFFNCTNLEYLDISGIEITSNANMSSMLHNMPKLKTLIISDSLASRISDTGLFTYSPTWYNSTGSQIYTASSPMTTGGTYYTEMPVCAHNDKTHSPAVAATCKSTGTVEYWYCNDCNKNIDASGAELSSLSTAIDPNNHKYTNYVYNGNATCIDDGTKTATCDYGCGKTDVQTATGTATGIHTFTNYVSNGDATCMADGTKTATCDISGCTAKETITDTGSQLAHNYTGAPWSNNPSEHWHVCVNTGCTATDTHVPHSFQWIVDTPATVTSTGVQHEECTACGFAKSQGTVIPVATCSHSNTTNNPAVTATCMSTGNVEYWHCNDCNKDIDATNTVLTNTTTAIDPNNHSFATYVYNNDAKCTQDGTETATCGYGCGAEDTRTKTGTMLNHDFTTAPWSTGTSNHWHVCTRTGCNETDTPAPHTFQWVVDTPATVTSTGVKHEACTVCGYTQSQGTVIPVLTCAHNNKAHNPAVTATCMQQGNVEYWYCSDCLKNVDAAGSELTTVVTPVDPNNHSFTDYVSNNDADCATDGTKTAHCDYGCGTDDTVTDVGSALGHDWATAWSVDTTNHWHVCTVCGDINDEAAHTYEWKITKEATTDEEGLMENLCTVCGHKDGEQEIAKLVDPNGEIDLPVDINVEFKVTQSSTDNDYSNIDKGLKRGYWAQLWYRNDDGTLGDEFTDKINCFLTLKIPTEIIEAIRGGEEINRDKIAEGLNVYFVNEAGAPVEVENFEIAMRDDDSWQIKFNYNEKFRAEVVFAADTVEQTPAEPKAGIPWWVWLIVGLVAVAIIGVIIIIVVVVKKKNGDGGATVAADNGEVIGRLDKQDKKIDRLIEITDGGFNDMVDGE